MMELVDIAGLDPVDRNGHVSSSLTMGTTISRGHARAKRIT